MLRIISALLFVFSSLLAASAPAWGDSTPASPADLELADNAPDRHIVVPGDTLWDIAARFLKQPYRWPEVWRLNQEEIKNPHRIYPGQVVVLDRREPLPRLRLGETVKVEPRIYSSAERQAIASIPQRVIEPFLAQPLVVEAKELDPAPRIVATQENRVYLGVGDVAYVTGLGGDAKLWNIYRPGKVLVDPETRQPLGVEALFLGSARLTASGEPATLEIVASRQEIGRGDRLLPAPRLDIMNYVPHAPAKPVAARVVAVYGGVAEAGRNSVVSLSRGSAEGLEPGHVLAIYRAGRTVSNRHEGKLEAYALPEERFGLVFVFRVFERVSYGLIMDASRPVVTGDSVRNP